MQNRPNMSLKRLVVMGEDGTRYYDQGFNKGLNVIYGANSAGKTTILDFIYYALGGDVKSWREEAKRCSLVAAEVRLNDDAVTIRRDIDVLEKEKRPFYVSWANYETAFSVGGPEWKKLSYSANGPMSFSQMIFSSLGIPECRYGTAESSSLCTMHNILRLLYVDQLTPLGRIFQVDEWDSYDRRSVVGDLLIGAYSKELYDIAGELRVLEGEKKDLKREKDIFIKAASKLGASLQSDQIENKIQRLETKRDKKYEQLEKKKQTTRLGVRKKPEDAKKVDELTTLQLTLNDLRIQTEQARLELVDTGLFIQALHKKEEAINESENVRGYLGSINFERCPCCMTELPEPNEGRCSLCSRPYPADQKKPSLSRLRFELRQQIENAEVLKKANEAHYRQLNEKLEQAEVQRKSLQKQVNAIAKNVVDFEKDCDSLLLEIGSLDEEIKQTAADREAAKRFEAVMSQLSKVKTRIAERELRQTALEGEVESRRRSAMNKIGSHIQALIDEDAPNSDLREVQGVRVSFREDAVFVGERVNFAASSMHYLRIAFPISFLQSAVEDEGFNHPLFTIIDSIEDKGLEQDRIYTLQRYMKKFSDGEGASTQIIFTTSDLVPELIGTECQAGPYWSREKRTLNFEGLPAKEKQQSDEQEEADW